MTDFSPKRTLLAAALPVAAALLAGCGTFNDMSNRIAGSITPYRIEIVQGNFVSREQVEALKTGMTRQQVREILGTPLVTDIFHADRWDYVFTLKRQGVGEQRRSLTVFFDGDRMTRTEGDPMPTEAEFVATLDNRRKAGSTVPQMQATEEQLRAAAVKPSGAPAPAPAPAQPAADAAPVNYPPLEPAR